MMDIIKVFFILVCCWSQYWGITWVGASRNVWEWYSVFTGKMQLQYCLHPHLEESHNALCLCTPLKTLPQFSKNKISQHPELPVKFQGDVRTKGWEWNVHCFSYILTENVNKTKADKKPQHFGVSFFLIFLFLKLF